MSRYLVSYAYRYVSSVRAGHVHWDYGNDVTDLVPAAWLLWAVREKYPAPTVFEAEVAILSHMEIHSPDLADELEEIL